MMKAKLNSQIQDIQKNKMNMYTNLGELVYNLTINGVISIEQCAGMCNEISSCNQRIDALQKEIIEIEMKKNAPVYMTEKPATDAVKCPNCGTGNPEGSKFCAVCGTPIPEIPEINKGVPTTDSIYTSGPLTGAMGVVCSNCETRNEPGAKFCAGCGANIAGAESVPTENICPKCFLKNEPGAKFCAACGIPLK